MQFTLNISQHDLDYKLKNITKFLRKGHNVKCIIKFKGREITFKEQGSELMERIKEQIKGYGVLPNVNLKGRNLIAVAQPIKMKVSQILQQ